MFFLIVVPWFVVMQRKVPGFFDFFFVREHLQRYLTPIEDRYQAWWFFLPVLPVGLLPWVPSALRVLASGWRASAARGAFDARRFLWCWIVVTFAFFSASDSKLVPYILPIFPALWVLMASADESALRRDTAWTAWGVVSCGVVLAAFAITQPVLAAHFAWDSTWLSLRPALIVMSVVLIAGGMASRVIRGDLALAHITIGVTAFTTFSLLLWAARGLTPLYSGEALVRALPQALRSAPAYAVRDYDQTLPFYLRRTTTLVEERNEMDFGLRLEPWRSIQQWPQFEAQWRDSKQALAVVDEKTLAQLQRCDLPLRVRARSGTEVLVSRR